MSSFVYTVTSRSCRKWQEAAKVRNEPVASDENFQGGERYIQDEKFACKFSLIRIAPLAGRIMDHTDMFMLCIQRNKDTSRT